MLYWSIRYIVHILKPRKAAYTDKNIKCKYKYQYNRIKIKLFKININYINN